MPVVLIAGAFLLTWSGSAHADPISIAILSAVGVNAVAGSIAVTITTAILTTIASIGVTVGKPLAMRRK